jgi:cardiolipin synthase
LFDSIGSFGSSDQFFRSLSQAGIEVQEFNPIMSPKEGNPFWLNTRDHRKILVVDGKVAFTGGINFSEYYHSSSLHWLRRKTDSPSVIDGWRDTHIAVRGPAVASFRKSFLELWSELTGDSCEELEDADPSYRPGEDAVALVTAEGGNERTSPIFEAYMKAIAAAKHSVWITQAYFLPGKNFMDLLRAAAERRVDVRILAPGISDSNLVLLASRSRYGRLLKSGVKIYESTHTILHAKTAVIDGIWSTVGSSNLDSRSCLHNHEANAIIIGRRFGRRMQQQFECDLEPARVIDHEEWKRRPLLQRINEHLCWIVEYWL